MFNDELHLLQVNPWADHWLSRPLYRGDVAKRGNVVPTFQELAILPAHQAAEEARSWLYGKPSDHVRDGLRAAVMDHPAASDPELQEIIRQLWLH
ncbi:hypothetical protein [Chromohalobacter sp. 11-W]|uniref:hypothetical protein n=1 Tax=Chromohalobacter sp. 11-W TaxID=2994061 RepID=UPI00246848F5|nr:hypothetical protein [Chromohalobacter sp. 11-W]